MKYILLNDIGNCFKNKKIIFCYIFCLMAFCVFGILDKIDFVKYKALGLILTNNFVEVLMFILNFLFYVYLIIYSFILDIKFNIDNIFLRFSKFKYILYKVISIIILVGIIKLLFHASLSFIYKFELNILIKDILLTLIVIFTFINILLNFKSILLIFILLYTIDLTNIININLFLLLSIFIVIILVVIYNRQFLFKLHERMR